jgi:PII-like signaling protein
MNLTENAHILKIYLGEDLYQGSSAVYEQIIYSARVWGLSGVTITKSDLGFGEAELRPDDKAHKLRISPQKPVVIEIVDAEEKLMEFLPNLKDMLGDNGLITLTPTRILHYGGAKSSAGSGC